MSITIHIKTNYLVIIGITLIVMFLGTFFTWWGMSWYKTLVLPSITPNECVFPTIWHIIYAFTATAAVLAFNRFERNMEWYVLMTFFCCNAFLNVYWSYLFFYEHLIGSAFIEALVLEATTIAILLLMGRFSRPMSLLLLPYAAWGLFAIVLFYCCINIGSIIAIIVQKLYQ